MKKSFILIILGFLLIVLDVFVPLAISQPISSIPSDGMLYASLTTCQITTPKPMSTGTPIEAYFKIDSGVEIRLPKISETSTEIIWGTGILNPSTGSHTFNFRVVIRLIMGSSTEANISGFFVITTATTLSGTWYINNIVITSETQNLTIYGNNVMFKFVKASIDPVDSAITCTVKWSGIASGSKQLASRGSGVWSDTITLQDGSYNIELKATDGTTVVMRFIYNFVINFPTNGDGNGDGGIQLGWISFLGLVLIISGSLIYIKEKK